MSDQSKRKFKVGDTVTNGITTKTIIAVWNDHYLTNCGKIPFHDEDKWTLIAKQPDNGEKTPTNND